MARLSNQILVTLEPNQWEYLETHIREGGKGLFIRKIINDYISTQGVNPEEVELRQEQLRIQREELQYRKREMALEEQRIAELEASLVDYLAKYEEKLKQQNEVWPEFAKALQRAVDAIKSSSNRDHVCRVRAQMLSNSFGEAYRRVSFEELLKLSNGSSTIDDFKVN